MISRLLACSSRLPLSHFSFTQLPEGKKVWDTRSPAGLATREETVRSQKFSKREVLAWAAYSQDKLTPWSHHPEMRLCVPPIPWIPASQQVQAKPSTALFRPRCSDPASFLLAISAIPVSQSTSTNISMFIAFLSISITDF